MQSLRSRFCHDWWTVDQWLQGWVEKGVEKRNRGRARERESSRWRRRDQTKNREEERERREEGEKRKRREEKRQVRERFKAKIPALLHSFLFLSRPIFLT